MWVVILFLKPDILETSRRSGFLCLYQELEGLTCFLVLGTQIVGLRFLVSLLQGF